MLLVILYPTPWQKKMLWNAITSLSLLVIAGVVVFTLYVATQILAFLQPLLLPMAVAGVFAYLLEPVVTWLARRKMPRILAVVIVFGVFVLGGALLVVGVVPSLYTESVKFSSALPGYLGRGWSALDGFLEENLEKLPQLVARCAASKRTQPYRQSARALPRTAPAPSAGTTGNLARQTAPRHS